LFVLPLPSSLVFCFYLLGVGVIQKTGVTTYMYGSHTISDNGETFALQSTRINLDRYINKRVIVKGSQVEGYPVDDGPKLIDVKEVQQK